MPRTRLTIVVLAAGAFAVSGCGGTTKTSTEASSAAKTGTTTAAQESTAPASEGNALSRTVLIAKADAICSRVRDRLEENRFHTQTEIGKLGPKIAAYEYAAVAQLKKLVPPASLVSDYQQIVKGTETLASDAALIGKYAKLHQLETPAGHTIVIQSGKHGVAEARIARRDGFAKCATML